MNLRFIDWIWHVRGSLALVPEQSSEEAFDRLDSLFRQRGTSHERTYDTLTFRKKAQAPQDKMSIFDDGVLRIEKGEGGSVLRYNLSSRALLLCFLAPLLFLGFAQLTIVVGKYQKSSTEASEKAKEEEKKKPELKLHPIDKFLGAPEPEKPKEDEKKKGKDKDKEKEDDKDKKPSPTPAYVFAAIFATLYVVGRILEDWLIKRLFRRKLAGY